MVSPLITQVKAWQWPQWVVAVALVIGAFLRLWNIPGTVQFLGDQGRDAIIAKEILVDHDPVLIGPVTSTGNMYLGPLYYYFMVPFLALTYPSPLGPAYAVATISIIGIFLMYRLGKEMLGEPTAALSSLLFAISAIVVEYARFSWNPNLAPVVGIIVVWATWKAWQAHPKYYILAALGVAVLIQLHYVALLTLPAIGTVFLRNVWERRQNSTQTHGKNAGKFVSWQTFWQCALVSVALFLAMQAPLVLFDARHDWLNARSFSKFLTQREGTISQVTQANKILRVASETHGRSLMLFAELYLGNLRLLNTVIVICILGTLGWLMRSTTGTKQQAIYVVLASFSGWAVLGLAFYESSVFAHYVAYFYPITLWLYSIMLWRATKVNQGKWLAVIGVTIFAAWNIPHIRLHSLGWTITDIKATAQTIHDHVQAGEKYNIVLLTGTGDIEGQNYRYFLNVSDRPPLPRERWGEVDTLFIINEDHKIKRVIDSPIYEIVVFPNKRPAEVYTIPNGPEITILRRE